MCWHLQQTNSAVCLWRTDRRESQGKQGAHGGGSDGELSEAVQLRTSFYCLIGALLRSYSGHVYYLWRMYIGLLYRQVSRTIHMFYSVHSATKFLLKSPSPFCSHLIAEQEQRKEKTRGGGRGNKDLVGNLLHRYRSFHSSVCGKATRKLPNMTHLLCGDCGVYGMMETLFSTCAHQSRSYILVPPAVNSILSQISQGLQNARGIYIQVHPFRHSNAATHS